MDYLYIATSSFPGNSAYATRIDGITQALRGEGNSITVLTDYSDTTVGRQLRCGVEIITSAHHIYPNRTLLDKLLAPIRMYAILRKLLKSRHFDCVIMSSIFMRFHRLFSLIKRYDIPVVLESCEWFDTYNWKNGSKSLEYKIYKKVWDGDFTKVDGVIAISRLLKQHYEEYNIPVIRVPTIMDIKNSPFREQNNRSKIKIVFVGSISWGKDRVSDLIEAISQVDTRKIEFHIYGPDRNAVLQQLSNENVLTNCGDSVIIHGKVPHSQVPEIITNCDFGVILRPDRRQSHAGFPTKLAEYYAAGTPVIANDTGDLSLYVSAPFLLPRKFEIKDLELLLHKIIQLDRGSLNNMRYEARETAQKNFDISANAKELSKFIQTICINR